MIAEAIGAVAATGGLGTIPMGQRAIRRRNYRACCRSIAALEREMGYTTAPLHDKYVAYVTAMSASKWREGLDRALKANHDERVRQAGYAAGRHSSAHAPRRRG